MLKAIWMSDLHFSSDDYVLGHDPRIRLKAAVDYVNKYHSDSSFCIISGDMVNRGTKADYLSAQKYLSKLSIPYFPMVGNHDDRSLFRSILSVENNCMNDFTQFYVETNEGIVVCLDTQKTGSDSGEFCTARKQWLINILNQANNTPVYIFMHHPPMNVGLPMQDNDKMENGSEFLELLGRFSNVKHLFIGHVHRLISGTVQGIPFATMPSVLYQAPAPHPKWNWDNFQPSKEDPALGVVSIADTQVNLQYIRFCSYELGAVT